LCLHIEDGLKNHFLTTSIFEEYLDGKEEINKLKEKLNDEFEMKDLDISKRILGMDIMRNHDKG